MSVSGSRIDYNFAERRLWDDAGALLLKIGLKNGQTLVDMGAGDGYFSIPAAQMAGPKGKIYAIDSSTENLAGLERRAREAGLSNIETVIGEAEKTVPCENCADMVLIANALHDFADPLAALRNASRMLKPGGRLADLDWRKEQDRLHGPSFAKRFSQEKAELLITQAGYKILSSALTGRFHYLIVATPA
ncbi:MAG: class I SAM-dependent methyltransferase [Dehalococcoidia bacterium]|nr:class I SAM-dependent methyltransferase [Dehalococcoidia bacterium]